MPNVFGPQHVIYIQLYITINNHGIIYRVGVLPTTLRNAEFDFHIGLVLAVSNYLCTQTYNIYI